MTGDWDLLAGHDDCDWDLLGELITRLEQDV
jgi:hypothetical protein